VEGGEKERERARREREEALTSWNSVIAMFKPKDGVRSKESLMEDGIQSKRHDLSAGLGAAYGYS
jgi:hypothetical protein